MAVSLGLIMSNAMHTSTIRWPAAIVFDLDGTLIDSAPDIARAAELALADHDIRIDADLARQWLGDGAHKLIERALTSVNAAPDAQTIETLTGRFSAIYQAAPCRHTVVYPGAQALLARLRTDNIRTAICTNKPHAVAVDIVNTLGLDRHIDTLIGGGEYPLKPSPAGILACLDRLGTPTDNTLYVGDMGVDRQAGHAAGLPVMLARFGYAGQDVERMGADGLFSAWSTFDAALAELRD